MFSDDLRAIDRFRHAAVNVLEPHTSGIFKLQAYAAQLVWMSGKFPVDIGIEFTWFPALGYNTHRAVSQDNLRFELGNIIFNLASLYSQLALASNRATSDGLKAACNYFCAAAGTLAHLRDTLIPDMRTTPPEDMEDATLESVERLMLAQAQECFWQKAVKDGLKDASIAKLAAKVSDYYSDASDWGIKSDAISSEWIHHMNAKHHHFAAAAQYRAACDCLEKRKYGEEVARLKDSLNCVNEALKETRWLNPSVQADLSGLRNKVQEDVKRAEKDNDMIYLIPVPSKPELKTIERVNMVTSRIPPEVADPLNYLGGQGSLGSPLFAKLVPYAVHVAASVYSDRRDRLVNEKIVEEYHTLNTQLHDTLKSLNLPGSLQALEKPLGLPPMVAAHADEIRQQDGIRRLQSALGDTEKLKNNDRQMYQEGVDMLRAEATEDEQARSKFGTHSWRRPASRDAATKLYGQVTEIDGYLKQAGNSDKLVQRKLKESESLIRLLGGDDRDIEDYVPSSRRATMTARVEREVDSLRSMLNDVNRLESRRRRKVESVRSKTKADDVHHDLLAESARLEREYPMQSIEAAQFENFFDKRLQMYDIDQRDVDGDRIAQEELIAHLRQANDTLNQVRQGDTSTKEREVALQKLDTAYLNYKEIISNLDVGRKFYNDLALIVTRFRDECRNFAHQRRAEAAQYEADITNSMAQLTLRNADHTARLRQERAQGHSTPQAARTATGEALTAPVPVKSNGRGLPAVQGESVTSNQTWNPELGIKFGQPPPGHSKPHR